MTYKVVLTDHVYPDLNHERETLAAVGAELVFLNTTNEQEIAPAVVDADAVITCYANISETIIKGMQKCKSISKTGIGVNNIDIDQATKQGIRVLNVPDYCIEEVSDHTVALMLTLMRRIVPLNNATSAGTWSLDSCRDMIRLRGKTLGFLGFGRIAQMTAQKLQAFGMKTIAYDPYVDAERFKALGVEKVELDNVVEQSHIISLNLPLTTETDGMVNEDFLNRMRSDAILVNTSRGGLINEQALYDAVSSHKIVGAGLDVLVTEGNLESNPLTKLENVIITPHAAFYSVDSTQELREKVIADVIAVLTGKQPRNQLNKF